MIRAALAALVTEPAPTTAEPAPTNGRRFLDYRDTAKKLGIPEGTLRSLVSRKLIPHVRITKRVVRFDLDELEEWLAARRVEARTAR